MKKLFSLFIFLNVGLLAIAQNKALGNDYFFIPGDDVTIPPGGKITLRVKQMVNDIPTDAFIKNEQWTIDGKDLAAQNPKEGVFTLERLQLDRGVYTAPAAPPPNNPVIITISFQPEGKTEKIILYCYVHILNYENFFYLKKPNVPEGSLFELKESPLTSSRKMRETAYYSNDEWVLGIQGFRKSSKEDAAPQLMTMGLSFVGNATGTYEWSVHGDNKTGLTPPCNTVSVNGLTDSGSPFLYISSDCVAHGDNHCKLVTLEGSTTITIFDKKNKIIKGYFSGILISPEFEYVTVSGAFSVFMQ